MNRAPEIKLRADCLPAIDKLYYLIYSMSQKDLDLVAGLITINNLKRKSKNRIKFNIK